MEPPLWGGDGISRLGKLRKRGDPGFLKPKTSELIVEEAMRLDFLILALFYQFFRQTVSLWTHGGGVIPGRVVTLEVSL